ncbi:hypothetical protein [Kitasatospora sp. NPDC088779]|uniref:hypothetical protein n=1 Tax=Kitasatospora sp. NPDC088779 TaxID=3154964 RepID=UPI003432D72C
MNRGVDGWHTPPVGPSRHVRVLNLVPREGNIANRNKQQGTRWESALRDHLNKALGHVDQEGRLLDPFDPGNVRRPAQEGRLDVGDLHAVPVIIEAKDVANSAVPTWLRQARAEAVNAGFPFGLVAVKERRAAVARGKVHADVRTWTRLRLDLGLDTATMRRRYGWRPCLRGLDTNRWYLSTDVAHLPALVRDLRDAHRFAEDQVV